MSVNKGLIIIFCFILLIVIVSFYSTQKTTSDGSDTMIPITQLYVQAKNSYTEGDYVNSIRIYKKILESDPEQKKVYGFIANVYRYWGKFNESEKWFKEAIRQNPKSAWLLTDLGKLYRNTGQYDLSEQTFYKSLKIDPSMDITYSYGLGYLFFETGEFEKSEKMFRKAIEINPTDDMAYSGLADLYREMGKYKDSEEMYRKAFTINPKSESYLGIGWLYIYQEKYEDAEIAFNTFLLEIREKGEVYYALGHTYTALNRPEEARESFRKAIMLNPDNQDFKNALKDFDSKNNPY